MPAVSPLPTYPPASARKSLSASQLATFHQNVSNALAEILALPPTKRDTPATRAFLSSYINDIAHQTLQSLIWEVPPYTDNHVHARVLLLAEKLAMVPSCFDVKTLLDVAIAYFPYPTRVRALFAAALASTPSLAVVFTSDMVPVLTTLLSPSQSAGLYGLRKTARCFVSLLSGCPPELVRPFGRDQDFMIGLAQAYEEGLAALARSYGGLRTDVGTRELDDWERIWLETKVDLIDSFHIIITGMLQDLSVASGTALATESERTFSIVFALLDLPSPPVVQAAGTPTSAPFLSRSLMADYQHSYNLSSTLTTALRRAAREDARVDLLESTLRSFDIESSTAGTKDPGALKLIIKSSGVPPGASASGKSKAAQSSNKGKAKEVRPGPEPHDLDLEILQVMEIFPDQSREYIQTLLTQSVLKNAEKVIEALLEGTAPGEPLLAKDVGVRKGADTVVNEPIERRNVFDDEILDVSKIRVGKKNQDEASVLRDRAAIDQMKADILRRAEAMSDGEEDDDGGKAAEVDDLEFGDEVKVIGDGEASSEGENDGDEDRAPPKPNPETVLELAYIRDPELFGRDANTRRSKARSELKAETGWSDEQIEGWKIMLERNPNKDKILQKHEFSGNRPGELSTPGNAGGSGSSSRGGDRGRGRGGRGAGRGRGRGRGSGDGGDAKERAWKDKNKASRGNHNRKRGHDKKMAKAGPS